GLLALALARHTVHLGDGVVDDLPLERAHRLELLLLARLRHLLRGGAPDPAELLTPVRAPPGDVEHQPAARTRFLLNRQPCQLLECLEDVAPRADELLEVVATVDTDDRAARLDVQVDVAVVVEQVEQPLQVVTRDVALADEQVLTGFRLLGLVGLLSRAGHPGGRGLVPGPGRAGRRLLLFRADPLCGLGHVVSPLSPVQVCSWSGGRRSRQRRLPPFDFFFPWLAGRCRLPPFFAQAPPFALLPVLFCDEPFLFAFCDDCSEELPADADSESPEACFFAACFGVFCGFCPGCGLFGR